MNKKEEKFVQAIWDFYTQHGRHDLPWRKKQTPYRVLVSELMLQQTQVERVIPKFNTFIKRFPSVKELSQASLGEVLLLWQGLGYNRRAKFLWETAEKIESEYGGVFPKDFKELQTLPGVGPYTAGAICAFSYNTFVPLIETNIKTVYIHHFFKNKTEVHDTEIMKALLRTSPCDNTRDWYAALMDYGSYLKREVGNVNTKSVSYQKQSQFAGSQRQLRGAIVRLLTQFHEAGLTKARITKDIELFTAKEIAGQLKALETEGLLIRDGRRYRLP